MCAELSRPVDDDVRVYISTFYDYYSMYYDEGKWSVIIIVYYYYNAFGFQITYFSHWPALYESIP